MTMVYAYLAVNKDKRILAVDFARVVPNDQIFTRMIYEGADKVLTWGTDVPSFDWKNEDRDTELTVSLNVALMHYRLTGHLARMERPLIALLEKPSGKWGATCTDCHRVVCKPVEAKHLPMVILTGQQHVTMSHY